jgi:hypothetical protein
MKIQEELDLDKISSLAQEMVKDLENERPYDVKYNYLKEVTPSIYDMILAKTENFIPTLMFMLEKLREIRENKETQEKQSEKVGTFLAEKYIYPVIDMTKENILTVTEKEVKNKNCNNSNEE